MDTTTHRMADLFRQLGLPAEDPDIDRFILAHRRQYTSGALADASFWTASQAQFLREALASDAEWANIVDKLSARLNV